MEKAPQRLSGGLFIGLYLTMRKILYFLLACSTLSALGCEGYRVADGIVLDENTKTPLDGALYEVVGIGEKQYTDSTGVFAVHGRFGGCMPNCPDIVVQFSKKGYKTVQIKNPADSVFYLVQEEK